MTGDGRRRLLLVVGIGRSGTSFFSGVMGELGWYVPQPVVKANDTNPRGFGEPRWVVDFHADLQRMHRVTNMDSRPAAFAKMAALGNRPRVHDQLRDWLAGQLEKGGDVVVKDPRSVWFLPLWRQCASELGAETSFATMLRHPTEVLVSARRSYGTWQNDASRAASWLNVMLHTEEATRGSPRAFVRYDDLLTDWEKEVGRIAPALHAEWMAEVDESARTRLGEFVDPTLRRSRPGWDELEVPDRLRDMIEGVWEEFVGLTRPGGDTPAAAAGLDAAREAYCVFYAEAEAVTQSTIHAARHGGPTRPRSIRHRLARLVPAPLRRLVPERVRRLLLPSP